MKACHASIALASALALLPGPAAAAESDDVAGRTLLDTVARLDDAVFASFNQCEDAAQLRRHAGYFASDVEFYHDTGGVTWSRDDMLANTAKHVCGKIRRELVAGSLAVYPIKDFGAIEQGVHRFCQVDTGRCEGMADFVIVWRHQDDQWHATRVLSYGHRPSPAATVHSPSAGATMAADD